MIVILIMTEARLPSKELYCISLLRLPDGDYLAIVVREATYDRTKIICSDISKDRNSYITSKAFSVVDGVISVKP